MGCASLSFCWTFETISLMATFWPTFLWLHLPIVVEALFSIVSTKSLLVATGRQLRGGAVQLPFDLGWRWGMKHHWNEKRDEGRTGRGQLINREYNTSFCKPCNELIVLGTHVKSHTRESQKLKHRTVHLKPMRSSLKSEITIWHFY